MGISDKSNYSYSTRIVADSQSVLERKDVTPEPFIFATVAVACRLSAVCAAIWARSSQHPAIMGIIFAVACATLMPSLLTLVVFGDPRGHPCITIAACVLGVPFGVVSGMVGRRVRLRFRRRTKDNSADVNLDS